jgi:hypothetical protein
MIISKLPVGSARRTIFVKLLVLLNRVARLFSLVRIAGYATLRTLASTPGWTASRLPTMILLALVQVSITIHEDLMFAGNSCSLNTNSGIWFRKVTFQVKVGPRGSVQTMARHSAELLVDSFSFRCGFSRSTS